MAYSLTRLAIERGQVHTSLKAESMLETSKDLLFITLAFCVLLFTAFSCWLLYYFIAIIKNVYDVTKSIGEKMKIIDEILQTIKGSIKNTANYISLAVNGIDKIIDIVQNKKTADKKKTKK